MPVAISVVIPTYNRVGRLPRLIEALESQRFTEPFEAVVVDDASSDGTAAAVRDLAAKTSFPVVYLRQSVNRGPAAARNRGWRAGQGPLVCFTDDDCLPTSAWLAEMSRALSAADVVQGRTLPDPADEHNRGPFSHTLRVESEVGYYETANMGYRRALLERLGGFDETFRFAYGEDCELAWRAKMGGATTAFCESALVYHAITPSKWSAALLNTRRREGIVQVFRNHPELRRHLEKQGILYRPIHGPAIAALASMLALVVVPKSRVARAASVAATGWYASRCRLTYSRPALGRLGWVGAVPAALIVDLAEVAVLAQASVRYRTLVL